MDSPEYYRFHVSAEARGRWEEAWRRASALQARMRAEALQAEGAACSARSRAEALRLEYLEVREGRRAMTLEELLSIVRANLDSKVETHGT